MTIEFVLSRKFLRWAAWAFIFVQNLKGSGEDSKKQDFCSSPSTIRSHPVEMTIIPLRAWLN